MFTMHTFITPLESRQLFAAAPIPQLSGTYTGTASSAFGASNVFTVTVVSQNKKKVQLELDIASFSIENFTLPAISLPLKGSISGKDQIKTSKGTKVDVAGLKKPANITVKLSIDVPADGSTLSGSGTIKGKADKTAINLPITFNLTHPVTTQFN